MGVPSTDRSMAAALTRLRTRAVPRGGPLPSVDGARTGSRPTLATLRAGQRAVVASLDETIDDPTARRLVDLGFGPGTVVELVRCAPFRGPMIFRAADYEIALRRHLAEGILAEEGAVREDAPL